MDDQQLGSPKAYVRGKTQGTKRRPTVDFISHTQPSEASRQFTIDGNSTARNSEVGLSYRKSITSGLPIQKKSSLRPKDHIGSIIYEKSLLPGVGEYDLLSECSVDSKGGTIPKTKRVTIVDEIANRKVPGVGEYCLLSDSFTTEGKKILTKIPRALRVTITDEIANRKIPGATDYSPLRPQKTLGGTIA